MKVKRVGRLWPRDKFEFFRNNHDLWTQLKEGEVIEVPDELFAELKGVEEVKQESGENLPPTRKRGRPPINTIEAEE